MSSNQPEHAGTQNASVDQHQIEADVAEVAATTATPNAKTSRRRTGNPVVWREMYTRFESASAPATIALFILLVGLPTVLVYAVGVDSQDALLQLSLRGTRLFEYSVMFILGLLMLTTIIQASGAIALERDRQTLMPMQITLLRPWQIAVGKIRVAVTFSSYLALLCTPILAVSWSVGGISFSSLVLAIVLLLATIVFVAAVSVWCSSFARRITTAAMFSMVTVGFIIIAPTILYAAIAIADGVRGDDPVSNPKELFATNPFVAFADGLGDASVRQDETFESFPVGRSSVGTISGPFSGLKYEMLKLEYDDLGTGEFGFEEGLAVPGTIPIFIDDAVPEGVVFDEEGFPVFEEGFPVFDDEGNPVLDVPASEVPVDETITFGTPAPGGLLATDSGALLATDSGAARPTRLSGIPLWIDYLIFVCLITVVAAWGTSRRLRTPAVTER